MLYKLNYKHFLLYQFFAWLLVSLTYSSLVRSDEYIGLVHLLGLYVNFISLLALLLLNFLLLRSNIKSNVLYYSIIFVSAFVFNQLGFYSISDEFPIANLIEPADDYYRGENLLFTSSSLVSCLVVFSYAYIKQKQKNVLPEKV